MRGFALVPILFVALASPARALPCRADAALEDAAARLLVEGRGNSPAALLEAAHAAGSTAPAVHALRAPAGAAAAVERWLARLAERVDGPLVCGEAESDGSRLVLAAGSAGALALDGDRVRVRLAEGFREPHVVVRALDGTMRRFGVDEQMLLEGLVLPDELPRPLDVQLVAEGEHGPRPVAVLRVGEGTAPPVLEGETDLVRGVDALRRAHGVMPLRDNRLLGREAEAHARRVCTLARVAHHGAEGANPEERLRRRGVVARVVGETVARAPTRQATLEALERSPSHLMTLVDRRFTDAGYGTAVDGDGHVCAVVLLAAWPRVTGR